MEALKTDKEMKGKPRYFIGIDLGGTNIATAVVNECGTIYGRSTRKTNAPRPYEEIFSDPKVELSEEAKKDEE